MAGKLKRLVYKEVLEGDLRKAQADSNDDPTAGGGARDLRLRPWAGHFEDVVARMAARSDETKGGTRYHVDLTSVTGSGGPTTEQVKFWPPTNARPNEGRLANIDRIPAFANAQMPPAGDGRALYLLWEDDEGVYASVISEASLRSGQWHDAVADPILKDLDKATKTVRGYIDFETGRRGFGHTF